MDTEMQIARASQQPTNREIFDFVTAFAIISDLSFCDRRELKPMMATGYEKKATADTDHGYSISPFRIEHTLREAGAYGEKGKDYMIPGKSRYPFRVEHIPVQVAAYVKKVRAYMVSGRSTNRLRPQH